MAIRTVTSTEAARSLSDILNQVKYQGTSFEIQRGKEVVAKIVPSSPLCQMEINELNSFMEALPHLDNEELDSFEHDIEEGKQRLGPEKDPWE